MFAVLKTGGKQYRVAAGDVLRVEKLACEAGETVQFNDVMMLVGDDVTVGTPLIAGAAVQADVIDQIRGEKLIHFVKRRRKHGSQRTKGHRQYLTLLRVTDILMSGADASGVKAAMGAGSMTVAERNAAADAKAKPGKPMSTAPEAETPVNATTKAKASKTKSPDMKSLEGVAKGSAKPAKADATADQAEAEADEGMATSTIAAIAGAAVVAGAAVAAGAYAATHRDDASDKKPANLLDAPRDGKADDLKKISGVGPKLEGTLNENGVFHFDQIAEWNAEEVAQMDELLSFKGRIERDGWIEQAKTFAADKE